MMVLEFPYPYFGFGFCGFDDKMSVPPMWANTGNMPHKGFKPCKRGKTKKSAKLNKHKKRRKRSEVAK